jgi:hypothetical protein
MYVRRGISFKQKFCNARTSLKWGMRKSKFGKRVVHWSMPFHQCFFFFSILAMEISDHGFVPLTFWSDQIMRYMSGILRNSNK